MHSTFVDKMTIAFWTAEEEVNCKLQVGASDNEKSTWFAFLYFWKILEKNHSYNELFSLRPYSILSTWYMYFKWVTDDYAHEHQ